MTVEMTSPKMVPPSIFDNMMVDRLMGARKSRSRAPTLF